MKKAKAEVEVGVDYAGWLGYDGPPRAIFAIEIGGMPQDPVKLPCMREPKPEEVPALEAIVMKKVIACLNKPTS